MFSPDQKEQESVRGAVGPWAMRLAGCWWVCKLTRHGPSQRRVLGFKAQPPGDPPGVGVPKTTSEERTAFSERKVRGAQGGVHWRPAGAALPSPVGQPRSDNTPHPRVANPGSPESWAQLCGCCLLSFSLSSPRGQSAIVTGASQDISRDKAPGQASVCALSSPAWAWTALPLDQPPTPPGATRALRNHSGHF